MILKKFNWLEKIVIAGIQGNPVGFANIRNPYVYGEVSILYRAIGAVVGVAVAGFIAATTVKGDTFLTFAKESRLEVRKVVWPTRQELNQTTLIVLAATAVAALLLWGIDGILVWLVSLVTGIGA